MNSRVLRALGVAAIALAGALTFSTPASATPVSAASCTPGQAATLGASSYTINGVSGFPNLASVQSGDDVTVTFYLYGGCDPRTLSFVSYTAPTSYFDRVTAEQQVVFDSVTGTFGPGTHTMSIEVPSCYFQVDFVRGTVITQFGPSSSTNYYGDQGRLIAYKNGGTTTCAVAPPTTTTTTTIPPTTTTVAPTTTTSVPTTTTTIPGSTTTTVVAPTTTSSSTTTSLPGSTTTLVGSTSTIPTTTTTEAEVSGVTVEKDDVLAMTGFEALRLCLLAFGAIVVGVMLIRVTRRKD